MMGNGLHHKELKFRERYYPPTSDINTLTLFDLPALICQPLLATSRTEITYWAILACEKNMTQYAAILHEILKKHHTLK